MIQVIKDDEHSTSIILGISEIQHMYIFKALQEHQATNNAQCMYNEEETEELNELVAMLNPTNGTLYIDGTVNDLNA